MAGESWAGCATIKRMTGEQIFGNSRFSDSEEVRIANRQAQAALSRVRELSPSDHGTALALSEALSLLQPTDDLPFEYSILYPEAA